MPAITIPISYRRYIGIAIALCDTASGGVTNAAIAYFAKPEFAQSPPRAVVWEVPERMIEEPVAASDERWAEALAQGNSAGNPAK